MSAATPPSAGPDAGAVPEDAIFRASRVLAHGPGAVYAAFEQPAHLAAWWGPEGFTNTFECFEFRVGGLWRFTRHGPDGRDYANQSVFQALEPGRRLVIRHDCAPYFTLTVSLRPEAGGTRIDWTQVFDDVQVARGVRPIVGSANEQNLDRLARVLAAS